MTYRPTVSSLALRALSSRASIGVQQQRGKEQPRIHNLPLGPTLDEQHRTPHLPPPINKIPAELLGEIFLHYVRHQSIGSGRPRITYGKWSVSSPITLGKVCGRWRSVSLSMAILWSSIHIVWPQMGMIPTIRMWLQRAGDCPLSLYIGQGHDSEGARDAAIEQVLKLFVTRVHLWKDIHFSLSSGPYDCLLDLQEGAATMLTSASLDLRVWDPSSADQLWRVLHASPTLRRASWDGRFELELPTHVPWTQLTHVTLRCSLTVERIMELVKLCPQVVVLEVKVDNGPTTPSRSVPLPLPHLRRLNIVAFTLEYRFLFSRLLLPSLMYLNIKYSCASGTMDCITDLVSRSQCQLRSLTLNDVGLDDDSLLHVLAFPSLQCLGELELEGHITNGIVRSLTKGQNHGTYLLPILNTITLAFLGCHTSDGVLSDMAASRLPSLRVFRVEGLPLELRYIQDRAVIDSFRKEGYQFSMSLY